MNENKNQELTRMKKEIKKETKRKRGINFVKAGGF